MAKKQLMSFKLDDLRVVLHCEKCGAEVSSAVGSGLRVPSGCPGCRADWGEPKDSEYKKETEGLISILRSVSAKSEPSGEETYTQPWTVRLVIEGGPGEDV